MSNESKIASGCVFDIQRYSIHDGPGIRTVVFLKGCPLRCMWCANPESQRFSPELTYQAQRCTGCQTCVAACPQQAIRVEEGRLLVDRNRCVGCGTCAKACLFHALKLNGTQMSVDEVVKVVEKDLPFYKKSGGGVTLSGGEALAQPVFALELLKALKARGIHTAVETAGVVPENVLYRTEADLFLFDLKHIDDAAHRHYIGAGNQQILRNLEMLIAKGREVIVRMPMIPDVNMAPEVLHASGAFLQGIGAKKVHLLPYHRLGLAKYEFLDRAYSMEDTMPPDETTMNEAYAILRSYSLDVSHS